MIDDKQDIGRRIALKESILFLWKARKGKYGWKFDKTLKTS